MLTSLRDATWDQIQALREKIEAALAASPSLVEAAQQLTSAFAGEVASVALARVFLAAPLARLPAEERAWAEQLAGRPLALATPTLCLLGSSGKEPAWNHRARSAGHRAIPLVDRAMLDGAPMLAELLASLKVELAELGGGTTVQLRSMAGGINSRFFVADARVALDAQGRHIIAARDFVARHQIRTVFGMGGTYVNGLVAIAILFTTELLDAAVVDRFSSFIGTFKIATSDLVTRDALFS